MTKMATTPNGLPYPVGTDKVVDGDDAIRALALALDPYLGKWNYGNAATDVNGVVLVSHLLGAAPKAVFIQYADTPAGPPVALRITTRVPAASFTATTFEVQFIRQDTGAAFASNPVSFYWLALR